MLVGGLVLEAEVVDTEKIVTESDPLELVVESEETRLTVVVDDEVGSP